MNDRVKWMLWIAIFLFLLTVPYFTDSFFLTMMIRIMYYSMLAIAFSFLAGQLGLFSLMIPVFFGITGYTIAILETKKILFFPYSALSGILLSLVFATIFGWIVNRTKGVYYLMLTLVLGQLVWAMVLQWVSLTKGSNGISGLDIPELLKLTVNGVNTGFYYFILLIFIPVAIGILALMRSSYGLKLRGIRESESRMIMLGYHVSFLKWSAFMISSFISSLSGMLFVYYTGLINPDTIGLQQSNQIMIASIFGGVGSIFGAILGTGIIKTLEIVLSGITQRYLLIIGILFLAVILYAPKGVMGILEKLTKRKEDNG